MNYRNATIQDTDFLVKFRLEFTCGMRGIGSTIVKKLIETAKKKGIQIVMLNASEMGRLIYKKLGFKDIERGMIYDGR